VRQATGRSRQRKDKTSGIQIMCDQEGTDESMKIDIEFCGA